MKRPVGTSTHLTFATTIFVGATLLFACQPIVARMIVPLLGGAPSVWIVCSLCFQTLLLAGYAYAHFVGTRWPVRAQVLMQLVLVGAVFLVLPVSVDEDTVTRLTTGHPTVGLLLLLLRTIGLPFFVLSTSSPLLQRWFAELGEHDPYHLYAASNAGSMVALLGYPLAIEPLLAVRAQSHALHAAFAAYSVLIVLCASISVRRPSTSRVETTPAPAQVHVDETSGPPLSMQSILVGRPNKWKRWGERLLWVGLSFAPSSLLLGATEYVTTDIASVPLLWVLPLALYLLSFIFAFAKKQIVPPIMFSRALAVMTVAVVGLTLARVTGPSWLVVGAHMLLVFLASVVCHRGLAERRPHVSRLTEFYLLMSIGGVLGGVFNGLVAPFLFDDLAEYPIAIGLVCLGRAIVQGKIGDRRSLVRDVVLGAALGIATFALVKLGASGKIESGRSFGWMFGVPIVFAVVWADRPVRFAVAVGGLGLAGLSHGGPYGTTLWADRGFFGVLKVTEDSGHHFRSLVSGTAMHGRQSLDPTRANVPLAYYYPTGPAGDVLGPLPPHGPPRRVGVIGLGVGSLAAYARPGDEWTFFELNPTVVEVARQQFTFLRTAEQVAHVAIEMGDARQRLHQGPGARFDVLVLDAFSSDAVPVHLVTREALAVYSRALTPDGVLLGHVSNDHVRLSPVFAVLAREAGMTAAVRTDDQPSADEVALGKMPSEWVLLSLAPKAPPHGWQPLVPSPSQSVWTDDYANVLAALRF